MHVAWSRPASLTAGAASPRSPRCATRTVAWSASTCLIQKTGNEAFVGIVVPPEWRDSWTLIREPDRHGIRRALAAFDGEVDLVHYDSNKTYAGRMYGYPLLWNALVSGSLFISDDIQDNLGFRDFAAWLGVTPAVVESGGKYVGLLRKL